MPDLTPTEAVGDALVAWVRSMGGGPSWLRPYGAARVVLDALSAAGRLLPEGGETRTEWEVRWHAGEDDNSIRSWLGGFASRQAAADASLTKIGEYGITRATLWRRERRDYGERGTWIGPWVAVDQEAADAAG